MNYKLVQVNIIMARPVGVEPTAFCSVAKRSIQLSYGRINFFHVLNYISKMAFFQ